MVLLLSRGVGLLAKSLVGFSCTQTARCQPQGCSSLTGAVSALQHSASRWFSRNEHQDEFKKLPSRDDYPKRPLTSFFRFIAHQRPNVLKKYPDIRIFEVSKILALEWKELSESAKKPYIDASNADYLNYKDEMRKFRAKLSPVEMELIKCQRKQKLVKRIHTKRRRELSLLGKPKGNRNAFNIFMSENFVDNKSASLSDRLISLHDKWKNMNSPQKQMYIQLAEDDKIRYENEMKSWEEQMLEIGREDLIRLKVKKRLGIHKAAVMHKASTSRKLPKVVKKSSEETPGSIRVHSERRPEE
ncbi:transcription factor A, mitochondrial isoform X2 [Pseudophryne corroboree]|uniref:transcription factor A, mitochondrial isoform X2 n=1 Tax=Pseudophryne corroboree TaxID=495146 RepID=UPI00308145CF